MKPSIITFTTMEEFERLMVYAAREKMHWFRIAPKTVPEDVISGVVVYLRTQGSCAICVGDNGELGYSPVAYFQNTSWYNDYEFKTAQEVLGGGGVDCTIPEET